MPYNGRGYEQLSVACAMERIAYSLCYASALACGWLVSKLFFLFFREGFLFSFLTTKNG
jgi:hypothetical protein